MFIEIKLAHFVPMSVKKVSNMCFAKMYYINHLTHKNCRTVDISCSAGQLID